MANTGGSFGGGFGGTVQMGRGTVFLEVAGNIDEKLNDVMSKLDMMAKVGDTTSQAAAASLSTNMVGAAASVADVILDLGSTFRAFGMGIINTMSGVADTFLEAGIQFQAMKSRFDFAYGPEKSEEAWGRALDIASKTLMSTQDVVDQAIMLQRSGVDALAPMVLSKTGEMIPAMEALSDLAATKGDRGAFLMGRLQQQFFSGSTDAALSHLRILFDLPEAQMAVYKAGMVGADTAQKRFEAFAKVTGQLFGGAGRAMGYTWEFQMAQLQDQWEIFRYDVSAGFLSATGEGFNFLGGLLTKLRAIEKETKIFSNAFKRIAEIGGWISVNVLEPISDWMIEFLKENPKVIEWVTVFAAGLALVSIGVGTLMTGFVMFTAVVVGTLAMMSAFLMMLPIIIPLGIALGSLAAAGYGLYKSWDQNFGGIQRIISKVVLGLKGVFAVLTSLQDGVGTMSESMANDLEEAGMLQWVIDVSSALFRLGHGAMGIWDGIKTGLLRAWAVIEPILGNMFGTSFDLSGVSTFSGWIDKIVAKINNMSPEEWYALGKKIGIFIADLITQWPVIVDGFKQAKNVIMTLVDAVTSLAAAWNFMKGVMLTLQPLFNLMAASMAPVIMAARAMGVIPDSTGSDTPTPTRAPGVAAITKTSGLFGGGRASTDAAPVTQQIVNTGGGSGTRVIMKIDGKAVGEAMVGAAERERYRTGLNSG